MQMEKKNPKTKTFFDFEAFFLICLCIFLIFYFFFVIFDFFCLLEPLAQEVHLNVHLNFSFEGNLSQCCKAGLERAWS